MKINFETAITDLRGRQLDEHGRVYAPPTPPAEGEKPADGPEPMTLGLVCYTALNAGMMDEKSYAKSRERYELMIRLYGSAGGGEQDVIAKQVTLLQDLIAKVWSPLIVGRAGDLLEPKQPESGA